MAGTFSPLHRVGHTCVRLRLTVAQIAVLSATAQQSAETVRPSPVDYTHAFPPLRCIRSTDTCAAAAVRPQESSIEHHLFAWTISPSSVVTFVHSATSLGTRCYLAFVDSHFQRFLSHFSIVEKQNIVLLRSELHAGHGWSLALKGQYPVYRMWRVRLHSQACTITAWVLYFCCFLFTVGQHAKEGVQDWV
jgi:hypothetical protein